MNVCVSMSECQLVEMLSVIAFHLSFRVGAQNVTLVSLYQPQIVFFLHVHQGKLRKRIAFT